MLVIGAAGLAVTRVLCIGAHSDDIEIGAAGTILALRERNPDMAVDWLVLSATGERADEARRSAERLLDGLPQATVRVSEFRERYFPYDPALKELFDTLPASPMPDLVLCPWRGDAHQDHRTVAELVHTTFRDQLVLEYEIPKTDGDLGRPSVYVRLTPAQVEAKVTTILEGFPSQASRGWFSADTFRGLMRLRGIECGAPSGHAEAFHANKVVLA
jgi:LmbE family N-acetylglucosaminyl deacetylase